MEGLYAILDGEPLAVHNLNGRFGEVPSELGVGTRSKAFDVAVANRKANRKDAFARCWSSTIGGEAVGFPWHRRSIEVSQAFQPDIL